MRSVSAIERKDRHVAQRRVVRAVRLFRCLIVLAGVGLGTAPAASGTENKTIHAPPRPKELPSKGSLGDVRYDCLSGESDECTIRAFMASQRICALLVLRDGHFIDEHYQNSDPQVCQDAEQPRNGPGKRYGIASVTKSITSTLVG
ncbi:hypothetical protein [Ensifer aridi]|uniref:hypothetical protein n=1 Tax=Ensifer aridi TaxID=1708715 RepID=UPI00358E5C00